MTHCNNQQHLTDCSENVCTLYHCKVTSLLSYSESREAGKSDSSTVSVVSSSMFSWLWHAAMLANSQAGNHPTQRESQQFQTRLPPIVNTFSAYFDAFFDAYCFNRSMVRHVSLFKSPAGKAQARAFSPIRERSHS